jgi:hypothetical protein
MKSCLVWIIIGVAILVAFVLLALNHHATIVPIQECIEGAKIYGFWNGLWHGMISPITFIASLFNHDFAVYAVNNNGGWYNFGFLWGVGALFGGGSRATKSK